MNSMFYIFGVTREERLNDFRWNLTGGRGCQENTILKGTTKLYGPIYKQNLRKVSNSTYMTNAK